jgi:MoaA/NifB/PqqE/SkfB family radical SAM enzyme
MKDFKDWGVKRRCFPSNNYNAIWFNLKTIRLGEGVAKELEPDKAEFYDVGINTLCNAECPFCYVSASGNGINYPNICETWEKWMSKFKEYKNDDKVKITLTEKPFQIAIGSTGEPTIHPEFCEFLETVFNTGVVPNYTTNGISIAKDSELSEQILEHTRNYVGGVAVSMGNKKLYKYAVKAINKLICFGNTNVNIHHIISDKASVNAFINEWKLYGDQILYHVLLPLMPSGRSTRGVQEGVFEYLENEIERLNIKNVAFGAHFIDALQTSKIKTWLYPAESLSKNIILTKDKVQITPSSFNLNPIKTINL